MDMMKVNNRISKTKQMLINLKKIYKLLFGYKKEIVSITICMLFSFAVSFSLPILSRKLVDDGLMKKDFNMLLIICSIMLFMYVFSFLLSYFKEKTRLKVYTSIKYGLEKESFYHLMKIKMDYFRDVNPVSIYNTINEDIGNISSVANNQTFEVMNMLLSAVGGAISLCMMEWRLFIFILVFIPVNGLISYSMIKKNMPVMDMFFKKNRQFSDWYGDSVNGMTEIRLFGLQKNKEENITEKTFELESLEKKFGIFQEKNMLMQSLLMNLFSLSIYLLSGIIMLRHDISIGQIIAFESYSLLITQPIIQAYDSLFGISRIIPSVERFFSFIDYSEEESDGIKEIPCGNISFDNVSFSYADNNELFDNFSFEIEKGSKVAIIGNNGSGKTTLLNLILRILTPEKGTVRLAGNDIETYNVFSYREQFGVVSQNIYLFNSTIIENILLFRDIPKDRIEYVIELVNLKEVIEEKGSDYSVGNNGCKLSGGQKQKIALARAIIEPKPYVILDEATSNLDFETVRIVRNLFDSELKNSTVLCVTHSDDIAGMFTDTIRL